MAAEQTKDGFKVDFHNLHEYLMEWPQAVAALGKRSIILHSNSLLYLIPLQPLGNDRVTEIQMRVKTFPNRGWNLTGQEETIQYRW